MTMAYLIFGAMLDVAKRLSHEDCFVKNLVEEGGKHVEMFNSLAKMGGQSNDKANCLEFDYRYESFFEIDS